MKALKVKFLLFCALVLLIGSASAALGDWDEGDPYKMHYPQLPKQGGWDVALFSEGSIWLADDWQCSQTGPVSDIHFWVSWFLDDVQPIEGFSIRIWSDNPSGQFGWSEPNELLWERDFSSGDFTVRPMPDDWQGWFDPYWGEWDPLNHTQWAQVNITDIYEPFIQQEGEIYWLMIDVWSGGRIGWKQSGSPQFRDDAVYYDGLYWKELRDPETLESLDLAFVITTDEEEPGIKWEQLPDPYFCGLHAHDYDLGYGYERLILADDWLCEGGVVTDLHWWGSIENPGSGLWGFHLSIHANDDPCCLPVEPALWEADIPITSITEVPTGVYNNCGEEIIRYEYLLPPAEYFYQEAGNTYWFNVCALSNDPLDTCTWKWQEAGRNPMSIFCPAASKIWPFPDIWESIYWDPDYSDMAFVITSQEEEEPNDIKWIQNPDLDYTGIDVDATRDYSGMSLWEDHVLADDFSCTSTEAITDIHIWGSWYNDLLPYAEPNNVFFLLTIYEDLPVGDPRNPYDYSIPGDILWVWGFGPEEFDVTIEAENISEGYYFPSDIYAYQPDADWTCWRYDFYIDPCEAFIQQGTVEDPCVYWLGVQAEPGPMDPPVRFGWKTSLDHWNDDAVWAKGETWLHEPWQELRYPPGHPFMGESIDLAFAITTGTHEPNEPNEPNEPYTKPLAPHTKWSQPPIEIDPNADEPTYCGWDEQSYTNDPNFEYGYGWQIVADDFRCLGTMPVTSIHWLGSFVGWEGDEPPPVEPIAWRIGFWSNIPAGINAEYSYPEKLLWQIEADVAQTGYPMISYWKFNENTGNIAGDSANGNDGTITGATWTTGKDGSALYFHGGGWGAAGSDVVTVPHSANLDITGPFTVEAWIKAEGTDKYHMIMDKYSGGMEYNAYGFSFYLTDGNLRLSIYSGTNGAGNMAVPIIDLRDNAWHYVVGLWDGAYIKLYIDGEFKVQSSWAYPPGSTTYPLAIGKRPSGWGGYLPFEGTIDEVAIYGSALSPSEIKRHYQDGYPGPAYDVVKVGNYYQHSLYLEPNDYFWQDDYVDETEDETFWLSIAAIYPDDIVVEYPWGWHTRPWHWMDDAVTFDYDGPLVEGMTTEMSIIEPLEDIQSGESYDVAFELDTDPDYIKAEQLFTGIRDWPHYEDIDSTRRLDLPSHGPGNIYAADDWQCLKRTPVTAIVWWGSYIGYQYQACSDPVMTKPVKPDYFILTIYTDVPAGADPCYPFSHPGDMIWEYTAFGDDFDEVLVGFDKHPEYVEPFRTEPVFRYSVKLDRWFNQHKYNEIFWLSVQAVYEDIPEPYYPWGWTNHPHVFNDDAVQFYWDEVEQDFKWKEVLDQTGASADMSFMLFTDPDECVRCADYNISGLVEFKDYAVFALDWMWTGLPGGYANGDLNCSGKVDFEDLEIFCQQWLDSCP